MNQHLKNMYVTTLAVLVTALSTTAANAALPASVATSMTGITADVQSMFDLVFPVILLGVTLTIGIKLFKRFSGKI